ncbi:MAG: tetratricopeptide repeat protein [Candidatus Omnitrophica bacterium]|nr:tetratricopeptide repeat protein [Candidatus Omnitrophota bacterium]
MEPESLVSLLLVLSLLGLICLGAFVFLYRKKNEERLQRISSLLDSLDERMIHESSAFEKKSEQIRAAVIKQQEVFKEEHEIRINSESEIQSSLEILTHKLDETRQKHDQVEESMEFYGKKIESVRFKNEIQTAYSLIRGGKRDEAVDILQKLIEEDPTDKEVRLLLAHSLDDSDQFERVEKILKQGLEQHPSDPDFLASMAHLLWRKGEISEMAKTVTDGLIREPNHTGLLFERSLLNIHQKKHAAAVADLERILEQGIDSAEIRYNLGMAYVSLGKISSAIQELRQSVALDPLSAEGNHALGLALLSGHRYKESRDFLERAREYDPQNVSTRLDLAVALRMSGHPEKALDEANVAAELDPNSPRAVLEKALAHRDLSRLREALEVLENHLRSHPKSMRARSLKASILQDAERFTEAATELRALAETRPDDPDIYARLGHCLKRSGNPIEALETIEVGAKKAPHSPRIQLLWAKECLLQEQYDKVDGIVTYILPKLDEPRFRLGFIEIRTLLALKTGKLSSLIKIMDDLKKIVEAHPEILPLDEGGGIEDEELLGLGLEKREQEVYHALLDFLAGEIDFEMLDDSVTQLMKSHFHKPKAPAQPVAPPQETAPEQPEPAPVNSQPERTVETIEAPPEPSAATPQETPTEETVEQKPSELDEPESAVDEIEPSSGADAGETAEPEPVHRLEENAEEEKAADEPLESDDTEVIEGETPENEQPEGGEDVEAQSTEENAAPPEEPKPKPAKRRKKRSKKKASNPET